MKNVLFVKKAPGEDIWKNFYTQEFNHSKQNCIKKGIHISIWTFLVCGYLLLNYSPQIRHFLAHVLCSGALFSDYVERKEFSVSWKFSNFAALSGSACNLLCSDCNVSCEISIGGRRREKHFRCKLPAISTPKTAYLQAIIFRLPPPPLCP